MNIHTLALVLLFSPALVCCILVLNLWFSRRNETQSALMRLLAMGVVYFVAYALYLSPEANYRWMCSIDVIVEPFILVLLGSAMAYVYRHYKGRALRPSRIYLFYMAAVVQATSLWTAYYLVGFDNVVRFFELFDKARTASPERDVFKVLPAIYDTPLYRFFHFVDIVQISLLVGVMGVSIIVLCLLNLRSCGWRFGDLWRFWFRDFRTTTRRCVSYLMLLFLLTVSPLVLSGRTAVMNMPALSITMSVIISILLFCISYVEMFSRRREFTLRQLVNVQPYRAFPTGSDPVAMAGDAESSPSSLSGELRGAVGAMAGAADAITDDTDTVTSGEAVPQSPTAVASGTAGGATEGFVGSVPPTQARRQALMQQLHRVMEEERVYLDRDLRIDQLAARLNTNRNKITVLMQQMYGMSFRELINCRRVEAARQYLLEHPEATNDEVAWESGFADPSTFFRRFKDATGQTPRQWLLSQDLPSEVLPPAADMGVTESSDKGVPGPSEKGGTE